eukprot:25397-Chlamydomonas_euryale.AAC.1
MVVGHSTCSCVGLAPINQYDQPFMSRIGTSQQYTINRSPPPPPTQPHTARSRGVRPFLQYFKRAPSRSKHHSPAPLTPAPSRTRVPEHPTCTKTPPHPPPPKSPCTSLLIPLPIAFPFVCRRAHPV